ncbi:MAG TPA: S49 family peptidase, partial [Thiothrix sp.]|nr:S49 family peptidase [Thiothrix sp.]
MTEQHPPKTADNPASHHSEQTAIAALQTIALEGLKEQKRSRRWGIFFKVAFLVYLFAFLAIMLNNTVNNGKHLSTAKAITAVVDINGVIMDGNEASADLIIPSLQKAFADERTKGVIIRINSPGGSPVQSGYINDEIHRLKKKYKDIPVYAVAADLCASGGYYIAVAADKIFVDKATIIGSIGVRMDTFGFVDAMEELGVERRLLTAGEHKAIMDPFSPMNPSEKAHLETMLDNTHQQFIKVVKQGRGDRLSNNPKLFSGLFWNGEQSIGLGLADAQGSTASVARDIIGAEEIINFTTKEDFFERLTKQVSTSMAEA